MPTAEEIVIVNPDRFVAALLRKPTIALSCRPARYTKPPRPLICEACLYGNHDNCSNCGCCCVEVRRQQIMATVRNFFHNPLALET